MKRTTPSEAEKLFEIGWLAGIIDGEGSLAHYYCARKNRPDLKKSPTYGVYIVNTDMGIMNTAKKIYDRLGVYANINVKAESRHPGLGSFPNGKTCYELVVRRRIDVEVLLKLIAPYLRSTSKKIKANKMLEFFKLNPFNSKRQKRV